ncbi:glycogen/starch/alpha-glucan phosphorylase [Rhodopseudomonas sp. G2_2311]|uniref:glycogen/starch/alpha-glucan phosphorylase n=1 Tax=Rhodopseudomonas sp. G2_2311 TaxID=3114287 RepID=UPI0039C68978
MVVVSSAWNGHLPVQSLPEKNSSQLAPLDELALAEIKSAILAKLTLAIGKEAAHATKHDWYKASALALRDRIVHRWLVSEKESYDAGRKRVYYLSLEFLIGRLFTDSLNNMGLLAQFDAALGDLGVGLNDLRKCEPDAALGNGGLGRLAACFMESMATLEIPAYGYGIRYDYGLFRQIINHGWQQEFPDEWLSFGNPWELQRPEVVYQVKFGGHVDQVTDAKGYTRAVWTPGETVQAIAYDTPIVGWRGEHVNALRLWSARAPDPLLIDVFNTGDYLGATAHEARAEAICKFLYPNDESPAGRELRLRQEYFFVSASLQDLIKRHLDSDGQIRNLAKKAAIQLNDTHPSLAVAELMRLLVDVHALRWDDAWNITVATLSYTNHTLLPEALETWPLDLFQRTLPRHLEIIYRINEAHLGLAEARSPGDIEFRASVSLIDEKAGRRVRMGHLAFIGSHRVNGVSAMHSDLMKETVFHDLNFLYPGRITNKTNGITFRRWLTLANPGLTDLVRSVAGDEVLDDPTRLERLEAFAGDSAFQQQFRSVKHRNKVALARLIGERNNIRIDPSALFDVQIKRIHEYKRQLLNVLETIALYQAIKDEPNRDWVPRVKIFAGKAAASYRYAKLIIKLINDVAEVVNNDASIGGKLKVVFLADYNVSLAEVIIPAADLSEQISTAGMEASGTGNMKLALNGALTIGTLDGANIEIRDLVGPENIAIFGMEALEVVARRAQGLDATDVINRSPQLANAIRAIDSGVFSPDDRARFASVAHALRHLDHYMVSADFDSYYEAQRGIDARWRAGSAWTRAGILNVARMAWFSSDRTIREYAEEIWNVPTKPATQPSPARQAG